MTKLEYFKARQEAEMSCMQYKRMIDAGSDLYLVLDARPGPPEMLKQTIPGAVRIPIGELAERLNELPKDKTIVVNGFDVDCSIGVNGCIMLLENGYDAMELKGGMASWLKLGLDTIPLV